MVDTIIIPQFLSNILVGDEDVDRQWTEMEKSKGRFVTSTACFSCARLSATCLHWSPHVHSVFTRSLQGYPPFISSRLDSWSEFFRATLDGDLEI
jgi:hypothetical protein